MNRPLHERLEAALRTSPTLADAEIEVSASRGFKVTATVVSRDFEEKDEAKRQQLVWMAVLSQLKDDDAAKVEFIFTLTPSEAAELGLTN